MSSVARRGTVPPITARRRSVALGGALLVAILLLAARLAQLQIGEHAEFSALGEAQRVATIELPASRGQILDRTGVPLAMSLEAKDIYADPRYVEDPAATAATLSAALGLEAAAEGALARDLSEEGSSFAYVSRQVGAALATKVERLELAGIGMLPTTKRTYPADDLAPQVLGAVGFGDDDLPRGLAGLELQYDDLLSGSPGERVLEVARDGRPIVSGESTERTPVPGSDLVTTIDRQLQYGVQASLAQAVARNHAKGGTVIVLEPDTGDVLAMATAPWFDPNRLDRATEAQMRNRAALDAFEPGSVNKVITTAAAVEEGAVGLEERLMVADRIYVGDELIRDSHPHPTEQMTIGDIIAQSSNVGTIQVADRLGSGPLATYLARFGLGRPTGIDFPGEASGSLLTLSQWNETSRATMSYGQGISATPLQMAAVYATIANGGEWVAPRLGRATVGADGELTEAADSPRRRVVSERTAELVARMLAYAVDEGTGSAARIRGYQVAGKTGTARKPYEDRAGYSKRYVASFMGFLPASDPQVVIVAILDEPATVYGGIASAPLFQEVARYAIQRLGIAPGRQVPLPPNELATD
ncbi:MAG: penicillin-binding protein 2 [Actinomycetota bacterium]